jgi:hypothetical protein
MKIAPILFYLNLWDALFATTKEEPALLKFMKEHNEEMKLRVGKGYTFSTYEKYVFTYDKVNSFLAKVHKKKDIMFKDLDVTFIIGFWPLSTCK